MAVNSVGSTATTRPVEPQQTEDVRRTQEQERLREQRRREEEARRAAESNTQQQQPSSAVNGNGQTVGTVINTTA